VASTAARGTLALILKQQFKTFPETWEGKALSVGTFLAYLEITA
jgi:hypothetical protein